MGDQKNIQELRELFDTATKALLALDGVTFNDEHSNISLVKKSILAAEKDSSSENMETAIRTVNLFTANARNKALLGTDELTGLPNRSAFNVQIHDAIEKNGKEASPSSNPNNLLPDGKVPRISGENNYFALVLLDLDRFKGLNDNYGHQAGDAGLQAFADTLRQTLRKGDAISLGGRSRAARLGGDEFTIILHTTADNPEHAQENLDKALSRIKEELAVLSFYHDGKNFPLASSSSKNIYVIKEGDTQNDIMEAADTALYKDKKTKAERYLHAVEELKKNGIKNLNTVPDPRAAEGEKLTLQQIGEAIEDLRKAGEFEIHIPAGTELPDALKALEGHGITIVYDDTYEHTSASEPTNT